MHPHLRTALKVALPLVVIVAGIGGAKVLIDSKEPAPPREVVRPRPRVRVMTVAPEDVQLSVQAQGTVRPATESQLVAEVSGRVVEVSEHLAEGAFCPMGATLVRIDPRDYEVAIAQAEADLARFELALELETAEAESAVREWQMMQRAGEPPALVAREPQLKEARARVEAAKAGLEGAKRDLERTDVVAPYDARVMSKSVDLGQFVQRGTTLARIYSTAAAEVRLPLADDELAFVDLQLSRSDGEVIEAAGPAVTFRARFAGQEARWQGRIVRTEGQLDPSSRMVHVVARVKAPFASRPPMVPNLFVEAEIEGRNVTGVFRLPRYALLGDDEVAVVDADDRMHRRKVEVLRTTREEVIVQKGLETGERISLTPLEGFIDGMEVRAESIEPAAAGANGETR